MVMVDALTSCLFEYHVLPISVSFLYLEQLIDLERSLQEWIEHT